MKNFALTLLSIMLLTFSSCGNGMDDNEKMAREISECISENLKSLNDSTFSNIVITTVNDAGDSDDISVSSSGITADGRWQSLHQRLGKQ